jgi:putative acetyltransferase
VALIRPEEPSDGPAVTTLLLAAFPGHGPRVAALHEDVRSAEPRISLVAVEGSAVVGTVLLTGCLIDAPQRLVPALVLSPLAVVADRRRRGIGGALVRAALAAAEEAASPLVLLEGDPAYYARFGFRAGHSLGLRRPSLRIPDAGFQAVPLRTHRPWMTGTMVYPDVWWRHDLVGLRDASADSALTGPF